MENSTPFSYRGWDLFEAIDALKAYDAGATDSGINDPDMREAVRNYLAGLDPESRRRTCAILARQYLTDDAIGQGSGPREVVALAEWLEDL